MPEILGPFRDCVNLTQQIDRGLRAGRTPTDVAPRVRAQISRFKAELYFVSMIKRNLGFFQLEYTRAAEQVAGSEQRGLPVLKDQWHLLEGMYNRYVRGEILPLSKERQGSLATTFEPTMKSGPSTATDQLVVLTAAYKQMIPDIVELDNVFCHQYQMVVVSQRIDGYDNDSVSVARCVRHVLDAADAGMTALAELAYYFAEMDV